MKPLSDTELSELRSAVELLENPGLALALTNFIGTPIERVIEKLPYNWSNNIGVITETALKKAAEAALITMKDIPNKDSNQVWHKIGAVVCGGVGGAFGLTGLSTELPLSTILMLRSIADIARSHGESISSPECKTACLEVLALGGPGNLNNGFESGYYNIRLFLAKSVTEATEFIAASGVLGEAAPALVRLITLVAQRFGIQVSEKAAAQAIPLLGAAGGAIINTLFINHFQDAARGHFIIRKLERRYGKNVVKEIYTAVNVERMENR